jgi:hypothetical protein
MTYHKPLVVVLAGTLLFPLLITRPSYAWGDEGHRWINLAAAQKLPSDVPAFLRNSAPRLSFLGPEPDRWRDTKELFSALREVNGPDHFIDMDKRENFAELPNDRYRYGEWLRSQGKDPKDIGFLPYSILEGYQKIQVMFRLWRDQQNAAEREQIEQNIIYYAGVVGHYIADGSQPLHTTIHFNGWSTSQNPDLNTREPLHWRFEGEYVRAQLKLEDFNGMVNPAQRIGDPFSEIMNFLYDSHRQVPELYRLEKVVRWHSGNRNRESKQFVSKRMAAGAQMLANLWYTAWLNSAGTGAGQQQ